MSVTVTEAALLPFDVGAKVTLSVQLVWALSVPPPSGQVLALVRAKLLALVPVIVMLLMVSGALPVFDSVTVLGALVVFAFCLLKLRLVGDRMAVGAAPVPDMPAV